jgi:hypothetical protein
MIEGNCARTTGDGLQQQAGRAVLGILRQVDGRRPKTFGDSRITKVGLGGTAHTESRFESRMCLKAVHSK